MLKVYHSDRLEVLAEELASVLTQPVDDPLEPLLVGVQNPGMGGWLRRFLADRDGAVVNLVCLDARAWSARLCQALLGEAPASLPWDVAFLTWRVYASFNDIAGESMPWSALDGSARHRLARLLGRCYGDYQWRRPDWLAAWSVGAGDHWQASLWAQLGVQVSMDGLLAGLQATIGPGLSRAFWVGLEPPRLPPTLLQALAQRLDLHLLIGVTLDTPLDPAGVWHPLRQAGLAAERECHQQVMALGGEVLARATSAIPGTSLLGMLQADILADRPRGSDAAEPHPVSVRDRSLQIHVCHSPMREVEVLYDQLLALFQADSTLKPADVVVLTPDASPYGPLVEAVFGSAEGDRYIPFSVVESGGESGLLRAFLSLLRLPTEEFASAPVLAILENEAVRRRFGLGLDDLPLIQHWITTPGVRQVLATSGDGALALEPDWQRRLESLLLGYAMGEGRHLPVNGVLADAVVSEAQAPVLGRLRYFVESLDWLRNELASEALTVVDWRSRLEQILERFFEPAVDDQPALTLLHQALLGIVDDSTAAGVVGPVPLAALLGDLRGRFWGPPPGSVLPGVGVSFVSAGLLLGVPSPVVCVLGCGHSMIADAGTGTLNLLAVEHRPGFQQAHQHFLQALLSARRAFYASYVGRSVHDNRALPMPAPVSTLLGQLEAGFWVEGGGNLLSQVHFDHPLTSFSRRYFQRRGVLFSYAEELCAVSRLAGHGEAESGSLVTRNLDPPGHGWDAVELAKLGLFFRHPTRFLLRERLGLDLDEHVAAWSQDTTLAPGPPLAEALLDVHLQGPEPADLGSALRGAGLLPPGRLGEAALQAVRNRVSPFSRRLRETLSQAAVLNPLELETTIAGIRLVGRLHGVSPQGLLVFGADRPQAGDYLDLWLKHLALNVLSPPGVTPVSEWMDPGGGFSLQPVAEPIPILESLLDCYRLGLRRPLHLFPQSALAFARTLRAEEDLISEAMARGVWEGRDGVPGEEQDPYIQLAFRGEDPLDEEFARLANRVFGPLLERLREYGP